MSHQHPSISHLVHHHQDSPDQSSRHGPPLQQQQRPVYASMHDAPYEQHPLAPGMHDMHRSQHIAHPMHPPQHLHHTQQQQQQQQHQSSYHLSSEKLPVSEPPTQFARAYRSRKTRPCDFCRSRKARCVLETNKPCHNCQLNGRECTFVGPTTKRKRKPIETIDKDRAAAPIHPLLEPDKSSASRQRTASTSSVTQNRFEPYESSQARRKSAPTSGATPAAQRKISFAPSPPPWAHGQASTGAAADPDEDDELPSSMTLSRPFHELVATLVQGEVITNDDESDMSETSSIKDRAPIEERGLTPFVLGSSSSEDPVLQRQVHSHSSSTTPTGTDESTTGASASGSTGPFSKQLGEGVSVSAPADQKPAVARPAQPLEVRLVTRDPSKPVFFAFLPARPYANAKGQGKETGFQSYQNLREQLVKGRVAQLMALYSQRDAAAFPVLSDSQRQAFRVAATSKPSQLKSTAKTGESSAEHTERTSDSRRSSLTAGEGEKQGEANSATDEGEPEIPLPCVLSIATLSTATVYEPALRPASRKAWGYNLHALKEQFEVSSLVTIQVALTDLTGRPSINTTGNFMSLSQTYALAHMLGLHLDCTTWHFPREERDLRTRLFWALFVHDKWSSLCWGRPSIIHSEDHTVPLPSRSSLSPCREHLEDRALAFFDFGDSTHAYTTSRRNHEQACRTTGAIAGRKNSTCEDSSHNQHTPGDTFVGLCRLSVILSEVLASFHSVRAAANMRRDSFSVVQRVKSYLVELEDWKSVLPPSLRAVFEGGPRDDIPGTTSLQLSYFGVVLLLCRTALDAVTATETFDEARIMPAHLTAMHAAHAVVDFVESLQPEDYRGFWFHYGSHHLASCLSLLARVALGFSRMDEGELLTSAVNDVERLMRMLAEARRIYAWDLADLSLTRGRSILPALETRIPGFRRLAPLLTQLHPAAANASHGATSAGTSHPAHLGSGADGSFGGASATGPFGGTGGHAMAEAGGMDARGSGNHGETAPLLPATGNFGPHVPGLALDAAGMSAVGLGDWGPESLTNLNGAMQDPTMPWVTPSGGDSQGEGGSNGQGVGGHPHQATPLEGWMPVDIGWLHDMNGPS